MSPITEAASVLLTRGTKASEIYFVGRSPQLRFLGGFHAFPGGKVHTEDGKLADPARGVSVRHVAAVRELFEEAGVLLARQSDGSWASPSNNWPALRQELLEERLSFADLLSGLGLHLEGADLLPAGSLVTPPFPSMRFDTAFFVAHLPPGQTAEVWPGELSGGMWASAREALTAWARGEILLSPPTVSLAQALEGRRVDELPGLFRPTLQILERGALPAIWFSPGVRMLPLFCDGLPPTTHTNSYLVGSEKIYLIDPGPADPEVQATLFEAIESQGGPLPCAVVLTHHHPDHVGAAAASASRYRVPILAHPWTARALAGKVAVDTLLEEGDKLDLGEAPHGRGRWHLEAVHTPGHAPGHLAFYEPAYQLLFAGDMVSTLSSVIIAPPEGDLAVYLASLRRLQSFSTRLLLPGHGGPSARALAVLDEAVAHRVKREEQLLSALQKEPGGKTVEEMAGEMYRGLPERLMNLARLQLQAGLDKLRNEGRVEVQGGRWRAIG